jgi:sugar phosphate isomerase/epimerase
MELHLYKVIQIAGFLGANVAVFGSPKNRVRGNLSWYESNEIASIFLRRLIPHLEEANLVLTLEPNAPQYGADFLTNYWEVVQLSEAINSPWIKPQIDTGCAAMLGERPDDLFREFNPRHIHLSAPNLAPVLPTKDNLSFLQLLAKEKYKHWIVIEMLNTSQNGSKLALETAKWLVDEARYAQKNVI